MPSADVALILVKSTRTEAAGEATAEFLSADGVAITLQNGLGNLEKLGATLGQDRVVQGTTAQGATLIKPGLVHHAGHGLTYLNQSPAARLVTEVAALLNQARLETYLSDRLDGLLWGKLAINAGINPLTALLGVPNGILARFAETREVVCLAAQEVAVVASAQGITLPFVDACARALEVAALTASNRSSMLQDISRGARSEIREICGSVVSAGRRFGVPTPLNDELMRLVIELEEKSGSVELQSYVPAISAALTLRQREGFSL
jgi:2-dehydropantoate 2-reductase